MLLRWLAPTIIAAAMCATAAAGEWTFRSETLLNGDFQDVYLAGGYVYGATARGLAILQLQGLPRFVSDVSTPGMALGVTVQGQYAYLADGNAGLEIFDVSTPAEPRLVAQYDTPGTAYAVALFEQRAYIADDTGGIVVLDVADPEHPVFAGAFSATVPSANGVCVRREGIRVIAYVADWYWGLIVLDVTDPAQISQLGFYAFGDIYCWEVEVYQQYAYVAYSSAGLQIFDINGYHPYPVGQITLDGNVTGVSIWGNLLAIADDDWGVHLYRLDNPALPTPLGNYENIDYAVRLHLHGNQLAVAFTFGGARLLDVSNPQLPTLTGELDYPVFSCETLVAWNSYALAAEPLQGLHILNIFNPDNPVYVGNQPLDHDVIGLTVEGNLGYAVQGLGGLGIINLPALPAVDIAGRYRPINPLAMIQDVWPAGDRAYIAGFAIGMRVLDVSNPRLPQLIGAYGGPLSNTLSVAASGSYAFAADYFQNVLVLDVTDPGQITLTGSLQLNGLTWDLAAAEIGSGRYVFAADIEAGVRIIDVTDPAHPALIKTLSLPSGAYHLLVDGHLLFIASNGSGVAAADISNPQLAQIIDVFDNSGLARWISAGTGNLLAIADYYSLALVDYQPGPSPTPTTTPSPTPTGPPAATETPLPSATASPPGSPTQTPSATPTPPVMTPTPTPASSPTRTPAPSMTPATPTPEVTPTQPPAPDSPILAAGYMTTMLSASQGGMVTISAIVDPRHHLPAIELLYLGQPTGAVLLDDGAHGDGNAGDGVYALQLPVDGSSALPTGLYLLGLRSGTAGGQQNIWPQLVVEE